MRLRRAAAVGLFLLTFALGVGAQSPPPQPGSPASFTVESYEAELDRISAALDVAFAEPARVAELRASLAPQWHVAALGRLFQSDTDWLKDALTGFEKAKPEERAETVAKLKQRLAAMRKEAEAFAAEPAGSNAAEAAKLKEILARPEFKDVRGPSAWDVFWARVMRFIMNLLDKLLSKIPARPQVGQAFVWLVIALAAALLAVWLYRRLRRRERGDAPREIVPFAPSAKNWRRWLAEARAAAERGDWRDAVHLAYWSAISRLEESGAWIPDRARTPREYLRLLAEKSEDRGVLSELTRSFEAIWYGNRPAGPNEFQAAVAGIERLQCR